VEPAILFEPDAYLLDGPKLMGRQSAGNGFLRAALKAHAGRAVHALTNDRGKAVAFRDLALKLEPRVEPRWIPASRLDLVAQRGLMFRPDVNLGLHARERLRIGPGAYSLCGLTHTLCSHGSSDLIADIATAPVMPWDALICTSTAARRFVETLLDGQDDYLAWRFGQRLATPRPQLPIIPLGVHCDDFTFGAPERHAARAAFDLAEDEVAALFVGRLTFNAKAHPYPMLAGLEQAAQASGRRIALIQAGVFPSPPIRDAFHSAMARFCPSVRAIFVDGSDFDRFAQVWRAADLFVSLSDNYQETFGITPIEAMASGLPVLVTDWDGYKDTVRDGVDGFRIPTWAPAGGLSIGAAYAADHESSVFNFDYYLSRTSTTVSVDLQAVTERLTALVSDPALRRRLGDAGRARARSHYDWATVYRAYEDLWRELGQIRAARAGDPALRAGQAPRQAPTRMDPFLAFAHYPTWSITPATLARAVPGADAARYTGMTDHVLFGTWKEPPERVTALLASLQGQGRTLGEAAAALAEPVDRTIELAARLAKMGLVELAASHPAPT
jgi:starch synthase